MTINFTELFTLLGKVFNCHEVSETHTLAIPTDFVEIETAYETTGDTDLITGIPSMSTGYQGNSQNLASQLIPVAQKTIIKIVNADNPQPDTQFMTAYDELARQMITNSSTVKQNVIGGSVTPGTNTGTGIFNYSIKNKYGITNENIFPESVVITCTSDSQTGGQTLGNEAFTAQGEYEVSSPQSCLWPNKGSGSATSLYAISATADNSNGNLLTNSYFLSATTNWTLAGSAVIDNAITPYYGINTLNSTGNGTAIQVFQDGTTGTSGTLYPNTQYSLSYWGKGVGTVAITLDNGTSTFNDDAGTANSFTQAINTGTWTNYKTTFRTPKILPTITRLKITFTLVTGNVSVDFISLGTMTEVYPSGVSLAIHSGASQFYVGDSAIAQTTNTKAGKFQTYFDRFFQLREQNRQLPSAVSGAETIADTLIS